MTQLAINTDFLRGTLSPEPYLRAIAEAGFTHLHWCHQWCTDFLYSRHEIAQYKAWLKECNLQLLDIHGSAGGEKCWFATEEYRRRAGVELVVNRLEMMAELGGTGSLIMHAPRINQSYTPEQRAEKMREHEAVYRSLDELIPLLEKYDLRIALENLDDTFILLKQAMRDYTTDRIGITYDSGHGNFFGANGLDHLEELKDRLQALHLNDNDGSGDQHQPPFYGTVDWDRMVKILRTSSYPATGRPLSFEVAMRNTPFFDTARDADQQPEAIRAFLRDAHERMEKIAAAYLA